METPAPNALPDESAPPPSNHARRTSRRSRLSTGLFVLAGVGLLAGGIAFRLNDLHVQTVLSGSMRPTVSPGDLAITQGAPTSSLRVGDVIVFMPPDATVPVLHRITSREGDVITTKGDANNAADAWSVTLQGTTGYRLVFVVPYLGWLTELRRAGLIVAGLCVALLVLLELRKEVGNRKAQVAS
jgi:signal peptidase I